MDNYIKIASWNCNGLTNKMGELINFLSNKQIHIICLNEKKIVQLTKIKFPNYETIRRDRDRQGGGVAILLRNDVSSVYFQHKT